MSELVNCKDKCTILYRDNKTGKVCEKTGRFGKFVDVVEQCRNKDPNHKDQYTLLQYTALA